jgi:hypothetical protein
VSGHVPPGDLFKGRTKLRVEIVEAGLFHNQMFKCECSMLKEI